VDWHSILSLGGIGLLSFVLSFLGAAVGLVLGHLRLPLLIAHLGSPVAGASTNLAVSGLGALAGSYRHAREGRVWPSVVILIGIPSAVGAVVGVLLFIKVNRFWAHLILGAILVILGVKMMRARPARPPTGEVHPLGPLRVVGEVAIGLFLGMLASVTGLMMSSLRVPMMIRLLKIDTQVAVGSNMAIGFLTALVGAVASLLAGGGMDLAALAFVGPPTMLGSVLGARLTGRLRKETLQRLLGGTIAVLGLTMMVEGSWKATRARDLQPAPHTPVEEHELEDEEDEWPEWP
jgi:uncharacterized membrane protein YfcA